MGLFNTVTSSIRCPTCDGALEWQSKHLTYDGFLLADVMETIPLSEHVSGEMHTSCDACQMWYDVEIHNGKEGEIKSEPLPPNPIKLLK